jgi:uncharacterized oxidoreductase
MPIIDHERLEEVTGKIFQAIGVPRDGAQWVAHLLVLANLRGHDSHGVIRIPQYIASWQRGEADPVAEPEVVQEGPATAMVDGKLAFGQIVARRAMEIAMEKASKVGVAAVGAFNSNHVGRLADYTEMALKHDMLAILTVNAGGAAQRMAPWGGLSPGLATNPIAFACPTGRPPAISVDLATSIVAEGKVRVKRNRGDSIPPNWVMSPGGHPTTDPNVLYGDPPGTIMPAGEHKGYCLALMVEILAGILARGGYSTASPGPVRNGIFMWVMEIAQFVPVEIFRNEVDDLIRYLKSSPTVAGVDQVLTPGEPELLTEVQRRETGVFIEDRTWQEIMTIARDLGVTVPAQEP